jgi:hypothetical protein
MFGRGVAVGLLGVLWSSCVPTSAADPCAGVACGAGRCVVVDATAACWCDAGYEPQGLSCRPAPPVDLCSTNPCANLSQSLCLVSGATVRCACPDSRVEFQGSCVLRTPCLPTPCTVARRTTCEVVDGGARCLCDPGFAPEGDGCAAAPVWRCADQHAEGDEAEPDECPPLAKPLVAEVPALRSLSPAGDHDWLRLPVTPGRLYTFTAEAAAPESALLVDVYDEAGVTLLASDNRGASRAAVTFPSRSARVLHVRVRALRATDEVDYTAQFVVAGIDDYVDTPDEAATVVPGGAPFAGQVQYAGDRDVLWLELPARTAVRLALADGGVPDVVLEVSRPGGGARVLNSGEVISLTTPDIERLVLTARGQTPYSLGGFSLATAPQRPDDHSDEPAFGTVLPADVLPRDGLLEDTLDVDSFTVTQAVDRIYRLRWTYPYGNNLNVSTIDAERRVLGYSTLARKAYLWKATGDRPATVRVSSGWPYGNPQPYTIAVEDVGLDDHADTLARPTATSFETPIGGRLELTTDVDTFSFVAPAGRIVRASATNLAGSPGLTRVNVFDALGDLVGSGEGAATVLVATAGVHAVQVSRESTEFATTVLAYKLLVGDLGSDDHSGTPGGASPLTLGTPTTGVVQYEADVDAFAFTAVANHVYEVRCFRTGIGRCTLALKDPTGATQATGTIGGSSTLNALATVPGRWVVEVTGGAPPWTELGPYALTVTDVGAEDHGSTVVTATAVGVDTPVTATLGYDADVDVFSFPVVAGRVYAPTPTSGAPYLEVRDTTGTIAAAFYRGEALGFVAPSTTTLYLFASPAGAPLGAYSFTIVDRGPDDHANQPAGATSLTLGVTTVARLQYRDDVDAFTVPVTPGHLYRCACGVGSGNRCHLVVMAAGVGLPYSPWSTSDEQIIKAAGSVSALELLVSSDTESEQYDVTVTDLGPDDHGDARANATALPLDGSVVAGQLETSTDVDVFTIAAAAGEVVLLTCTPVAGPSCIVRVRDERDTLVIQSDLTSPFAPLRTGYLATGGAWVVELVDRASLYTLSATLGSDDVPSPTALSLASPRPGRIDYVGDTDDFTLALTAGVAVAVTVTAGARVTVTPPGGGLPLTYTGGPTSQYAPAVSGTYTFTVAAEATSPLVSYTLTVQ